MKITTKQYAEGLYQSVKGKSEKETNNIIDNFVNVLIANNDISKSNRIIEQFEIIWNKEEGIVEAEIVSSGKLSSGVVELLNDYIAKLSGAKEVVMQERVDKSVLGGVVIKYGDRILDGSLRMRLGELKNELIK